MNFVRTIFEIPNMMKKYKWHDKVVLLVEDDPSSLLLLQTILSHTGAKLLVAEDGETAIELVRENNDIDMVLMDIRLTGISGLLATERIKKIAPDITVIAQTACAVLGDMDMCLRAGCNAYITKPLHTDTLLETMDYYFKRAVAQDILDSVYFSN